MKCFLCSNELVYMSDDFKHLAWGRTGNIEIKRANYMCSCKSVRLAIDFPGEELYSFHIDVGHGYTLSGYSEDVIQIIYHKDRDDKKVIIPWVHAAGINNILSQLSELSEKYEIYVTFS